MIEDELKGNLFTLLERYRAATGQEELPVSRRATGNPTFFQKIRSGWGMTLRIYDRAVQWFSDNWPEGAEWPEGVKRPVSHSKEA